MLQILLQSRYNVMIENYNTEFKSILNDKLEKEVIAFLNSKGGHIYIGKDDNGNVVGIDNIDDVQLEIRDRLKEKIAPSCLGFLK